MMIKCVLIESYIHIIVAEFRGDSGCKLEDEHPETEDVVGLEEVGALFDVAVADSGHLFGADKPGLSFEDFLVSIDAISDEHFI
jgi:hypothetical protein